MSVVSTAVHSITQVGVGIVAGSIVDAAFPSFVNPSNKELTSLQVVEMMAEIGLQTIADGLLVAASYKMLSQLSPGAVDGSLGFGFMFGLMESQPHLRAKISRVSSSVRTMIHGFHTFEVSSVNGSYPPFNPDRVRQGTL